MPLKGVTMGMSRGIKGYWRKSRKGYERLDGSGLKSKKRFELVTLGSSSAPPPPASDPEQQQEQPGNKRGRRRFWGIKITPKLKFFFKRNSPKKILKRFRDAYVNMMLGFANSSVFSSGFSYVGNGGDSGFMKPARKEYDEKAIVEFYKSLMAQGQLMPRDAAKIVANGGGGGGGLVLCRRPLPSGF